MMGGIDLQHVYKSYPVRGGVKVVARDLSASFPGGVSVALMGRNGAGKSSLLRMIAGSLRPDRGDIRLRGRVSWPVGFAGSFHPDLTGRQNLRFVARLYGVDSDDLLAMVQDFAEVGAHFDQPLRSYSSGMRSRLAFGLSMAIDFDTYLVDEVTAVGDARFKEKSLQLFQQRMRGRGAIVVNHSLQTLRRMCQQGAVLEAGKLHYFNDLETAIHFYQRLMER